MPVACIILISAAIAIVWIIRFFSQTCPRGGRHDWRAVYGEDYRCAKCGQWWT